jgi:hypothetical protein
VLLSEEADEKLYVIDIPIELRQLVCETIVSGELLEVVDGFLTEKDPILVERSDALASRKSVGHQLRLP